jgi:hypothetical protein
MAQFRVLIFFVAVFFNSLFLFCKLKGFITIQSVFATAMIFNMHEDIPQNEMQQNCTQHRMTLRKMAISKMILNRITFYIFTQSKMTFSTMTISKMILE